MNEGAQLPLTFHKKDDPPNQPRLPLVPFGAMAAAQDLLREEMREGTTCPLCGQHAQIYKRKLNSAMARTLISFYLYWQKDPCFIHAIKVLDFGKPGPTFLGSDYGLLVHWSLTEECGGSREDGNPNSGYYRITEWGRAFVLCKLKVPMYTFHYNKECLGAGGDLITIRQALGDKFNYEELMRA